jgi:hypothetical protein
MPWSASLFANLAVCCLLGALAAGTIQAYRPASAMADTPPDALSTDLTSLLSRLDRLWRYGGEESITQDQINALLSTTLRSDPSPSSPSLAEFQRAYLILDDGLATLFIDHQLLGRFPHQLSLKLKIREHPLKGRQLVINEGSIGRLPLRGLLSFPARSASLKISRVYRAELEALARLPVIQIESGKLNLAGRLAPDS